MLKYHINNNLTDCVKDSARFQNLSDKDHEILYDEVCNATLQGIHDKIVSRVAENCKIDNKNNSTINL
jgi:cell fate (sporulation/competence/biofilm development) regulator YlbF (YheA/YmcA/DUF963 family)